MKSPAANRRDFLHQAGMLGGMAFLPSSIKDVTKSFAPQQPERIIAPSLKFGVVGINHGHLFDG